MQSKPIVLILLAASALFAAALVLKNAKPQLAPDWRAARVGVVRDAANGRPIAGAFVVARWLERSAPAFDATGVIAGRCLDRVVVRSDGDGRFAIPARADDRPLDADWNPTRSRRYARDLAVYASGYAASAPDAAPGGGEGMSAPVSAGSVRNRTDDTPLAFDLRSEQGDVGARLARLADAARGFACDAQARAAGTAAQAAAAQTPAAAIDEVIDADGFALACLSAGGDETALARLRAALRGERALADAHPCAARHTVSAAP